MRFGGSHEEQSMPAALLAKLTYASFLFTLSFHLFTDCFVRPGSCGPTLGNDGYFQPACSLLGRVFIGGIQLSRLSNSPRRPQDGNLPGHRGAHGN